MTTDVMQPSDLERGRSLAPRQDDSPHTGLPNRNLTDPLYNIQNTYGRLNSKTADTVLIHRGGWAEYDTHNLYVSMVCL